jgi:lysophospholipase L1-like esterase
MRITLAVVLAAGIAVAVYVALGDDETSTADAGAVTLVGDSLHVGVEPYLDEALPGWSIEHHNRVGKLSSEGVQELSELRATLAPVVVVSLGTNDAEGSEDEFARLVEQAVDLVGPRRCLVWVTIVRDGVERTSFDEVLREARASRPNLHLVEWAAMVAEDESLLASDQVHGTPEGYAKRAEEIARVVRDCAPDVSPR